MFSPSGVNIIIILLYRWPFINFIIIFYRQPASILDATAVPVFVSSRSDPIIVAASSHSDPEQVVVLVVPLLENHLYPVLVVVARACTCISFACESFKRSLLRIHRYS